MTVPGTFEVADVEMIEVFFCNSYFNTSYFGRGAYGIEMASRIFFNKTVMELTIPEGAVLIALLKSSVIYDPVRRYNNALRRRSIVMHEMYQDGYISEEDYRAFSELPIEHLHFLQ